MTLRGFCNICAWTLPAIYVGMHYGVFAGFSAFAALWVLTPNP